MNPCFAKAALWILAATAFLGTTAARALQAARDTPLPGCSPIDSAWAIHVHVTDAVSGKPVAHAQTEFGLWDWRSTTDSSGWACIRDLVKTSDTLRLTRSGYRDYVTTVKGSRGQLVVQEVRLQRVQAPCCNLRGKWRITFQLQRPNAFYKNPTKRSVAGELTLGPRVLGPQAGDNLDSIVRVERGLHQVDFTPFFGGPVAHDVSTTVMGGGPDLYHEVEASIPAADRLDITFIPRMSHGSLSLEGRIRRDTIRGRWIQNAYCCGARGRFVMYRIGPPDTTTLPALPLPDDGAHGLLGTARVQSLNIPPGSAPASRWRPQLDVAPTGRLWLASGGLFTADSLVAGWHRVLGGDDDPVLADELRIGLKMAFVGDSIAIIGMQSRYPVTSAPVIYRTADGGASWSAVMLDGVNDVYAAAAVGRSVWLVIRAKDLSTKLAESRDGGLTWTVRALPKSLQRVYALYRASDSMAFVTTSGTPSFWTTSDGGTRWSPVPSPHDQGMQQLGPMDTGVEQVARTSSMLLVNEHGRVFASLAATTKWKLLPDIRFIAWSAGIDTVFALTESLQPVFLDRDLHTIWKGEKLPITETGDVEQVLFDGHVGYVSSTGGALHEIRIGRVRVVRPAEH